MLIIPTIYLYNGKAVSVYKGDFERVTVYPRSPLNMVKEYYKQGARAMTLVDLNGNMETSFGNKKIISQIMTEVPGSYMVAGGIRSLETIQEVFDMGARVVLLGVSAYPLFKDALKKHGSDSIFIGLKAKKEKIVTEFTFHASPVEMLEFAQELVKIGVKNIVYKDMWSEGTMIHPNYDYVERLINLTKVNIFASGGIGELDHLQILKDTGARGALIGKALAEGKIDLQSAIATF